MVVVTGDDDVTFLIDCNSIRILELAIFYSSRSELGEEATFSREYLHSMIAAISNDDVTFLIDRYSSRILELTIF